jgi:hypothetical protein
MDYVPSGCVPSFTGEENWGIVQSSVLKICYPIVPSYFGMCTGPAGGLRGHSDTGMFVGFKNLVMNIYT